MFVACGAADRGAEERPLCGDGPLRTVPRRAHLWGGRGRAFSVVEQIGANQYRHVADERWSLSSPDVDRVRIEGHRVIALSPGAAALRVERSPSPSCWVSVEVLPEGIFGQRVERFEPGAGAGFGQDSLPDVVLGPPRGGGAYAGSTDVVSLGLEGVMVVGFDGVLGYDGPGADFLVFENVFLPQAGGDPYFEPARVSIGLSSRGPELAFPCEGSRPPFDGCAGLSPVYADAASVSDFTNPSEAGGDAFDLHALQREGEVSPFGSTFDRIAIQDVSDLAGGQALGTTSGFDLDAVALIHLVPAETRAITLRWDGAGDGDGDVGDGDGGVGDGDLSGERQAVVDLVVGDEVLLPDVSAVGRPEGPVEGLDVGIVVSGDAVTLGAGGTTLLARHVGTATITARVGPWAAAARIEVVR